MKVIGITGGVGSGKSTVLSLLKKHFNAYVIQADEVAKDIMKKGECGYQQVIEMFSDRILDARGEIDRVKLAKIVFANINKRMVLNSIIHPLVKRVILEKINEMKIKGQYEYFFVEAALLIEDHYNVICDELWYIYVPEEVRRIRLKENRGYSDNKISKIFKSQLTDNEFRKYCSCVIDNSNNVENTLGQLKKYLVP
ncbi:MAG: dephospho-CoA kinase [Eubacteriales bacterium]|nr:dephospho-CoA kinase [Eubacteriales bacterium]